MNYTLIMTEIAEIGHLRIFFQVWFLLHLAVSKMDFN